MKRIILTGGGTAGHVTPNIALLPRLRELGYDIQYIGSYSGIEKELIEPFGIPYHGISSGKLRRYLSVQNFTDPFRVIKGFGEARKLIKDLKPDVIFSKGGFVSVPVVLAGKRCKVPVIIHESDMTPGLALQHICWSSFSLLTTTGAQISTADLWRAGCSLQWRLYPVFARHADHPLLSVTVVLTVTGWREASPEIRRLPWCISCKIRCRPGAYMPVEPDIAVAHQSSAEMEIPVRSVGDCIAELVSLIEGIDKVIFSPDLPHG